MRPTRQGAEDRRERQDQRYGTCNTAESLLVARDVADIYLPEIAAMLAARAWRSAAAPSRSPCWQPGIAGAKLVEATEADWREEYLAPIIAVKIVAGIDEAIEHINTIRSSGPPKRSSPRTIPTPCASCAR